MGISPLWDCLCVVLVVKEQLCAFSPILIVICSFVPRGPNHVAGASRMPKTEPCYHWRNPHLPPRNPQSTQWQRRARGAGQDEQSKANKKNKNTPDSLCHSTRGDVVSLLWWSLLS